jgi:hypothetical protein
MAQEIDKSNAPSVPSADVINLGSNSLLDLTGMSPEQVAELKRQYASGMIALKKKASCPQGNYQSSSGPRWISREDGGLQTRRWRKADSNHRSHPERDGRGEGARSNRRLATGPQLNTGSSWSFRELPLATPGNLFHKSGTSLAAMPSFSAPRARCRSPYAA